MKNMIVRFAARLFFYGLLLASPLAVQAQTASTYYTAPSIAALKALATRPTVVEVVDSNPGVFNWSTTPCAAADDIFQVTPTSGPTGCYTRMATPYAVGNAGPANGVLITNGSKVPSFSTTLPAGVTAVASSIVPGTTTFSPNTNPGGVVYNNAGVVDIELPSAIPVISTGSTTARSLANRFAQSINVLDYGAVGDTTFVSGNVTIGSGSQALTVTGASFTSGDVGKVIVVPTAGAAGLSLWTTISAFIDATHVTLTAFAGTAVSASPQIVYYGTDDTTALQAAITAAVNKNLVLGPHLFMVTSTLTSTSSITIIGTLSSAGIYSSTCYTGLVAGTVNLNLLVMSASTSAISGVCFQMASQANAVTSGTALYLGSKTSSNTGFQAIGNQFNFPFVGIDTTGFGTLQNINTTVQGNVVQNASNNGVGYRFGVNSVLGNGTVDTRIYDNNCWFPFSNTATCFLYLDVGGPFMRGNDSYQAGYGTKFLPGAVAASYTAGISTTNMTVSAVGSGTLVRGQTITSGASGGTTIVSQTSGTPGGTGIYVVSASQTVSGGTSMTASAGQATNYAFVQDIMGDTSFTNDLYIDTASSSASIQLLNFAASWTSGGGTKSVRIANSSSGLLQNVHFSGHRFVLQSGATTGVSVEAGSYVQFDGNTFCSNTNLPSATALSIGGAVSTFDIRNNNFTQCGGTIGTGIAIAAGANAFNVSGNDLAGPTTALTYTPTAGGSDTAIVTNNIGIDNFSPTIASATTLALPNNPTVLVSGTTTVMAITGGWSNRAVTLTATNASGFSITGGAGSACHSVAVAQNAMVTLTWNFAQGCWLNTYGPSSFTLGSTSISLGSTTTTIAGLTLTAPTFTAPVLGTIASGVGTNLTGTASGLTAGNVTTNANLTGDITSIGNATTLATVATGATTGSSTAIPVVTFNNKGLVTAITTAAVIAPAGTLTGATLAAGVTASSLTSVGTLAGPVGISNNSASTSSLSLSDLNTGGKTWNIGPGAGTGSTTELNLYNVTNSNVVAKFGSTGNFTATGLISPASPATLTCGTGCASVTGNPQKFVVTSGTAQASVTVNFGITWSAAPVCAIGSGSTASVVDISSISTTAITFGASVALTATPINVLCF